MAAKPNNILWHSLYDVLNFSADACSSRGLYRSSKWLSEMLFYLQSDETCWNKLESKLKLSQIQFNFDYVHQIPPLYSQDFKLYKLGKCFFDCREFERCSHLLEKSTSPINIFLRLYCLYLAGEKYNINEGKVVLGPQDTSSKINSNIEFVIEETLKALKSYPKEPFFLYLLGICYKAQKQEKKALELFVDSINIFPYNWSVWLDLAECLTDYRELKKTNSLLPDHIMTIAFQLQALQEFHIEKNDVTELIEALSEIFPGSIWIDAQTAIAQYNLREYDLADRIFEDIYQRDPYRLDDIDIYSNILFVKENPTKLSYIAHVASKIDSFKPETCIAVGNHYSLSSEHEKSVLYFRRAIQLNPKFLAAWTLMGHEYVEMKNTHAAIEAYRRAIEVNKKDYRAWYGLGQTYEILEMDFFALYYYQRAAALRPMDQRMWSALGNCYESLNRNDTAIEAFQRAIMNDGNDALIALRLAQLHEKKGDMELAKACYLHCIAEEEGGQLTPYSARARIWMAKRDLSKGSYKSAEKLLLSVLNGSYEIEEAKSILRQIRSSIESSKKEARL